MADKQALRLSGKVAIVTGAGRGLGRAEAIELAKAGAKVLVNDYGGSTRGDGEAENVAAQVVEEIRKAGGEAAADLSDISSMDGAKAAVDAAVKAFGRVDILINNAGIARPGPIHKMDEADWDAVIKVHLKGHFAMVRNAAPVMIAQGGGVIVNVASQSGLGHWGNANYSAAKEGVVGFTRTIARDLGEYGIRVNALRPLGWTRLGTPDMMETIRYSQEVLGIPGNGNLWIAESSDGIPTPEQVGVFVAWLCTDAAANATGRTFYAGGGTIGLYPEPDLERAIYQPGGWTLDTLDAAGGPQLIGGLKNIMTKSPLSPKAR